MQRRRTSSGALSALRLGVGGRPVEPLPPLSESTNPPSPDRYPVVVVEDDAGIRTLVARLLRAHGYAVTVAESAEVALERLASLEAPLLLVDKNLPGMDGLELLEHVRASRSDFEAVLMTAYADVTGLMRGLKLGVFRCVLKPFHNEELLAAVGGAANRLWLRLDLRARKAELEARNQELERMLVQLREADRRRSLGERLESLGRLAAGVAHEINTPLAAVVANLALLDDEVAGLKVRIGEPHLTAEDLVKDAREGAERVRVIVRDLKTISRGDEERIEPVDVRAVLDTTVKVAWNEVRHRARLVKEYTAGPLPTVMGNAARLGQVFLNLLLNAAQAIPEGRAEDNEIRIVLDATDDERSVLVEVRDTGAGIPPEVQDSIFDPFFTTKPVGVGTGLGLSICHGVVTSFGGRISVDSQVGRGSTFRVSLPAAYPTPAATPPPSRPRPIASPLAAAPAGTATATATTVDPRVERPRVLAVDDDPLFLGTLRRVLAANHEVEAVASAREALDLLKRGERFDLILCDLMMPQMTGMDLFQEIVRLAPDLASRVVFLTGGAFSPRAQAFLERVPNARLEKPFCVREMQALIRERLATEVARC